MKFAVALSLVSLAFGSVLDKRECAGNNCNRAVTGTRDGLPAMSLRSADCASFLLTTVTPAAATITVTVYDDDAPSSKRDLIAARQATVTPTAIPQYATACSEAPRYASACSCFGVTGSVTTAPTPTVTVTSTIDYCDDL
ncbi:hypothetical protein QBC33DRAFT_30942 [Phialemonium atrogriseum]|uniref:Uncharacterized protein n=1 Tax=Phialemonium atrogriseum TaxID=1093897 RepID=A0AAJ0CA83_9PEZI|nr:uncharacterized protein QBC33DRAFT_30942 [Phialemonium atrogriseum]KAK1772825.1 hypothetical protein QBC33DRAFT_30942 [Phialemonium atrogriseum]